MESFWARIEVGKVSLTLAFAEGLPSLSICNQIKPSTGDLVYLASLILQTSPSLALPCTFVTLFLWDLTSDWFHVFSVISSSIQLLVQDLENACEPALTAMIKVCHRYKYDFKNHVLLICSQKEILNIACIQEITVNAICF